MTDATIVERDVIIPTDGETSHSPFSWSAAIAGAFAATAVTFIVAALGSGIGLSFASPFSSGPSATSLTVAAAVWLVMAQSLGFATGGYLAGRLRSPVHDGVLGETTFRDAAQGFIVWALGVVAMAAITGLLALYAAGTAASVAGASLGGMAAGAPDTGRSGTRTANPAGAAVDYYVDVMFRPGPDGTAPATAQQSTPSETVGVSPTPRGVLPAETRAEVVRVLARSVAQGQLDDNDRAYLAQLVAARTGVPRDEAERRVTEVDGKAREAVKDAADKAAKAGAYFSFWTFMSLLFGGAAATLAGMLGGQLRDDEGRLARVG